MLRIKFPCLPLNIFEQILWNPIGTFPKLEAVEKLPSFAFLSLAPRVTPFVILPGDKHEKARDENRSHFLEDKKLPASGGEEIGDGLGSACRGSARVG